MKNRVMNRKEFIKEGTLAIFEGMKWIPRSREPKLYFIRDRCIGADGTSCRICVVFCHKSGEAIRMGEKGPEINASICDRCGDCILACQTVNNTPALQMA